VVIAGRNGSGKSTFLRCLANVILPDRGQIIFSNGIAKDKIGFISDRLSLFENSTVQQGIDFHSSVFGIEDFDYSLVNELKLELNQKISAAIHSFSFTILYFALFCISLSLSASSDNFLILFVFSLLSLMAFLCLLFGVFWVTLQAKGYIFYEFEIRSFFTDSVDRYLVNLIIPVIGILLPLLISLFLAFRKFDMRPAKTYNKRFFKIFVPVFILGLIGSFVFSQQTLEIGYTHYFLTQDLQVVEANGYTGVKIYDRQTAYRVNIG
jgi:energy-coupling factor transporter ATP-binding protein EcfA2